MDNSFKEGWPEEIIIEPGRSMVGDSGVIVAEIVNIAKKSVHERYTWVFLDIGKFGGLIETLDESIKYPIYFEGSGKAIEGVLFPGYFLKWLQHRLLLRAIRLVLLQT